jgi:nucleotide-binding universal stress UspA family protein
MRQKIPPKKAHGKIWVMAVDPFADFDHSAVFGFAKHTAKQAGAQIHAVYVLAPAMLNWTGEFSGPWKKKYMPVAEAKLNQTLGNLPWERSVIATSEAGAKQVTKILANYARRLKAERILISTHARSGIERWAMGSFAETLILQSKIPVMITNPEKNIPSRVRKILVPTDLGKDALKTISHAAEQAKALGAHIILYYKQPDPADPIIQQGVYSLGGGWVSVQSFISDEINRKTKKIEQLESYLRKKRVPVSHVLDSGPGDLVESINRVAREKGADLVALRTQAGEWTASLLGSVARGLVRNASTPLLVER